MKKSTATIDLALASSGAILVFAPYAFLLVTSASHLLATRSFAMDYLIPAELFPVTLAGGALVIWASLRMKARRLSLAISLGVSVLCLVGSQGLAVATGLASGENEAAGWRLAVVVAALAISYAATLALGIGGILLAREALRRRHAAGAAGAEKGKPAE
jgi:hypothetical protein